MEFTHGAGGYRKEEYKHTYPKVATQKTAFVTTKIYDNLMKTSDLLDRQDKESEKGSK